MHFLQAKLDGRRILKLFPLSMTFYIAHFYVYLCELYNNLEHFNKAPLLILSYFWNSFVSKIKLIISFF